MQIQRSSIIGTFNFLVFNYLLSGKKKKERQGDMEITTQGMQMIPTKILLPALGLTVTWDHDSATPQ